MHKACDFELFDDELFQAVFIELLPARKSVSQCLANGGNRLYCKPQIEEKNNILRRLPFSDDSLEIIEKGRVSLLAKVAALESDVTEELLVIEELSELIDDAQTKYDALVLNRDHSALDSLDTQVKEWRNNIERSTNRVDVSRKVLGDFKSLFPAVDEMAKFITNELKKKKLKDAELKFIDFLDDFGNHYAEFIGVARKCDGGITYEHKNLIDHVEGVLFGKVKPVVQVGLVRKLQREVLEKMRQNAEL